MRNLLKRFVLQTFKAFGGISRVVALAQHLSTPVTGFHNCTGPVVRFKKLKSCQNDLGLFL